MIYYALVLYYWLETGEQERVLMHLLSLRQCQQDKAALEQMLLFPGQRLECEVET